MDSKKPKLFIEKTPLQLLNERLVKTGNVAKWELISDFTKKTTNVPSFAYKVTVGDIEVFGSGVTKKEAKQNAAKTMFMQISDDVALFQALQSSAPAMRDNFQNHIGNLSVSIY